MQIWLVEVEKVRQSSSAGLATCRIGKKCPVHRRESCGLLICEYVGYIFFYMYPAGFHSYSSQLFLQPVLLKMIIPLKHQPELLKDFNKPPFKSTLVWCYNCLFNTPPPEPELWVFIPTDYDAKVQELKRDPNYPLFDMTNQQREVFARIEFRTAYNTYLQQKLKQS